jgi:hypothetical protein
MRRERFSFLLLSFRAPWGLRSSSISIPTCSSRDTNGTRNVLKLGLERARGGEQPLLVRRRIGRFAPRKREAHESITKETTHP